jgi:o-succinylbenzoate synthase
VLNERTGWIIELTAADGTLGYGDCAPLPPAGTESAAKAHAWLQRQLADLTGQTAAEVLSALSLLSPAPAARHALESALLDLLSRAAGLSLRRWLSPQATDRLAVNASAGALDAQAGQRCAALIEQGFSVIKLKVGLAAMEQELQWLQTLCRGLPARLSLRLDANGAWSLSEARLFLDRVAGQAIESLEEPLARPHLEALRSLQETTPIALALDESLPRFPADELLSQAPVRRLILKPTVLGGLRPALALAEQAALAGIQTLVTSTLESALGVLAAAQLAAALPGTGKALAQGLATGSWFISDLADGLPIEQGQVRLPDTPGLGLGLNRKANSMEKE